MHNAPRTSLCRPENDIKDQSKLKVHRNHQERQNVYLVHMVFLLCKNTLLCLHFRLQCIPRHAFREKHFRHIPSKRLLLPVACCASLLNSRVQHCFLLVQSFSAANANKTKCQPDRRRHCRLPGVHFNLGCVLWSSTLAVCCISPRCKCG